LLLTFFNHFVPFEGLANKDIRLNMVYHMVAAFSKSKKKTLNAKKFTPEKFNLL
jgi:hypothetical protein